MQKEEDAKKDSQELLIYEKNNNNKEGSGKENVDLPNANVVRGSWEKNNGGGI